MNPRIIDGWLVVDCDAPDSARITIGTSANGEAKPAFRDYDNQARVAKVRVPEVTGRVRIIVTINGERREAGLISL